MTTQATKQTQPDELVGRVINDRFRIISVIARGGMGRVYRAEQVPLGRMVAIKTLDPRNKGGDSDPQFQARFFLEASVASKLQHPNTVTVFDYGRTADGIYFIAMELVEGRSLLNLIRQEAPLPPARVVHIAMQIARSLREAHRLDVIHRDLKPGNVLLTRHGDEEDFVKVLDFGLVKHIETESDQELTKTGLFMGSPKYMSPEQIRGERVDARADIYALGIVMYEMLTGHVPFERDNTVKVLMAHLHEPVPPLPAPDCPEALAQLVLRCLEKRPEHRPATLDEVIFLLKQASGMPLTSGNFALSQEVRLSSTPSPMQTGTPTHGFGYGSGLGSGPRSVPPEILSASAAPPSMSVPAASPIPSTLRLAPELSLPMPTPPEPRGVGWTPKLVLFAALAIAGGFFAMRFSQQPTASAPQSAQQPATGAQATTPPAPTVTPSRAPNAAPAAAESAPAHVLVRLTSTPSGATVIADGKPYGRTPADIEWWGDLAAEGRQIVFSFEKEGYERVTVVRTIHGDKLNVEAILPSRSRRRHSAPSDESAQAAPRGPVVVPEDFKKDPY